MRIAVKYCGNCNPEMDTTGIVPTLQEKFSVKGIEFVYDLSSSRNAIPLLLCGCSKGCLDKYVLYGKLMEWVIVRGRSVELHLPHGTTGLSDAFPILLGEEIKSWMQTRHCGVTAGLQDAGITGFRISSSGNPYMRYSTSFEKPLNIRPENNSYDTKQDYQTGNTSNKY